MGTPAEFVLDAVDGAGRGLRARFAWQGEHYDHAVFAVSGGVETLLLACRTLPIQEIVDHRRGGGSMALLATGAGDGRYWSLSVDARADAGLAILGFDVACRDSPELAPPQVDYLTPEGVAWDRHALTLADGRRFAVRLALAHGRTRWRYEFTLHDAP